MAKLAAVGIASLLMTGEAASGAAGYVVKLGDFNSPNGDIRNFGGTDITTGIEACNHDPTCSLVVFTRGTIFLKRLEDSGPWQPSAGGVSYLKSPHGGGTSDHWGGLLGDFRSPSGDVSGAFSNSDPFRGRQFCNRESGCDLSILRGGTTWNKNLDRSGQFYPDSSTVSWMRCDRVVLQAVFENYELFHGKQWDDQIQELVALPEETRSEMASNVLGQPDVQRALATPSPAMLAAPAPKTDVFSPFSFVGGMISALAAFGVFASMMKRRSTTEATVALLAEA